MIVQPCFTIVLENLILLNKDRGIHIADTFQHFKSFTSDHIISSLMSLKNHSAI